MVEMVGYAPTIPSMSTRYPTIELKSHICSIISLYSKVIENSIGWSDDHVVNTSNSLSYKLMETQLIPILVKAIQEADDKIDALTTRVTTLEG